ncbi:MAG: hypothetical protein A2V96_00440 [Candidatus Yonathbacteria bacterium RBG_16_43_6]|uniref:Uncharacterized protein n=2 Tax=Parcubacteria group TaxID=1794811 RepID=A0A1G2SDX6_9BACT|nr:MAG: hypothetical protein UW78_C0004G0025 [Candidatus Azambacteria bacterium GW2011_GWA1_44_9]OHA78727.1 MAG: hypothetical protein A2658_01165 [Candidatus Yonathbacteria bacterium RIFCSPHIGHO2_01_FULL_44_19]OHA79198.1 MAG: hypothetical protein A2V96_00440 [Candidatus Yonathbacteria bacterium RBG_16_43_6]OHA83174.1 MAG: hypothetical protein A3B07_00175 [Candidatus Yonathbacteria bacterium RIFCSPLOWO2_01_FULL_43_27]
MKILKIVLAIIVILLLIVLAWLFVTNKIGKEKITPPDTSLNTDVPSKTTNEQLCYIWNTEAGDRAKLSIDVRENKATGDFYWLLAKNEPKTGIFIGTVSPIDTKTMKQTIVALWDSKKGTKTRKEEIVIIFGKGIANVGFGEMKDRGDGVYEYTNPEKLSFEPNLQQTDCNDEAMR